MSERPIKVLLVDDDIDDICLIEEALSEIAEVRFSQPWMIPGELLQADQISDALVTMRSERVDVTLMALTLPDAHGLDGLRRIHDQDPDMPVVLLTSAEQESAAMSLVRQGAQDYLIRKELDCIPLARSLRCAIERQRVRSALRTVSFVDDLTGLYSDGGFHHLAAKHWQLARRAGKEIRLHLHELSGLDEIRNTFGIQEKEMALLLVTDILRRAYRETDVIGRLSPSRFAVAAFDCSQEEEKIVLESVTAGISSSNSRRGDVCPLRVRFSTADSASSRAESFEALVDAVEAGLCENNLSKEKAAP